MRTATVARAACAAGLLAMSSAAAVPENTCQVSVGGHSYDFSSIKGKNWTIDDSRDSFSYRFVVCGALGVDAMRGLPSQNCSTGNIGATASVVQYSTTHGNCFKVGDDKSLMAFEHKKGVRLEYTESGATCFHNFRIILECDPAVGIGRPLSVNEVTECVYETIWPSSLGCVTNTPPKLAAADKRPAPAPPLATAPAQRQRIPTRSGSVSTATAPLPTAATLSHPVTPHGPVKPLFAAKELDKSSSVFGLHGLFSDTKLTKADGTTEKAIGLQKTPVEQGITLLLFAVAGYCILGGLFKAIVQKEAGLEAVPHIDTLRNAPMYLKDRFRFLSSDGSWRGGYSQVPGDMIDTGADRGPGEEMAATFT